jgi:RNA-directed DNA polymerase
MVSGAGTRSVRRKDKDSPEEGFDFPGFNIRRYRGKNGKKIKTIIKPSKDSINKIRGRLREEWMSLKNKEVKVITRRLNPIIRGWSNYYRTVVSTRVFSSLDCWMMRREARYVKQRHPTRSWRWQQERYWGRLNPNRADNWVFGDTAPLRDKPTYAKDKMSCQHITKFSWTKIRRHILVKGRSSPDDPRLRRYWEKRMRRGTIELTESYRRLADKQKDRCPYCNESLFNGEELHKHHIIPRNKGGKDSYRNLMLVHHVCHQQKHCG